MTAAMTVQYGNRHQNLPTEHRTEVRLLNVALRYAVIHPAQALAAARAIAHLLPPDHQVRGEAVDK